MDNGRWTMYRAVCMFATGRRWQLNKKWKMKEWKVKNESYQWRVKNGCFQVIFKKFFKKGFILHCKWLIIRSCFAATEDAEETENTEGRGGAANEEWRMKSEKWKMRFGLSFIVRRLGFRGVTSAIYHSPFVTRHSSFVTRHSSLVIRHSSLVIRH